MGIDDPLQVSLQQVKQDLDHDIERDMKAASAAGLISCIPLPGVGAAIQSLLDGRAQRNLQRRWLQLFEEMGRRLEEIKDSIPDADYFSSEEFQTLLALAWEQLQTTHDERKRKLLAHGLANSGAKDFVGDGLKEQYLRTLRDLSPNDLEVLRKLRPVVSPQIPEPIFPPKKDPTSEELCSLTRLVGLGLVAERLEINQFRRSIGRFGLAPPDRVYQMSLYGLRFLEFLSDTADQM